jgi:choline-phosphate cytidylyltransferase
LDVFQGTAIRDRIQERLRGQLSNGLLENGKANSEDDDEEYYYDDDDYDDDDDDEEYYTETYDKDAKSKK